MQPNKKSYLRVYEETFENAIIVILHRDAKLLVMKTKNTKVKYIGEFRVLRENMLSMDSLITYGSYFVLRIKNVHTFRF